MASKRDGAGGGPKSAGRKGGGAAAIAAAIEDAAPAPGAGVVVPFGFEMRPEGLYRLKTTEKPEFRICGPFEIVAESRPEAHDEWGLLLRWADADRRIHEWIMPKRLLAGEAVEIRSRLIKCGLDLATHDVARRALVQFLAAVRIPARVRTVSATGWYRPPTGNAAFVLPRQTLGVVTGEVVRLDIDPPPPI